MGYSNKYIYPCLVMKAANMRGMDAQCIFFLKEFATLGTPPSSDLELGQDLILEAGLRIRVKLT